MADILADFRSLEIELESKLQDISIANQKIARLESEIADLTNTDSTYVSNESQIDFIRKVAESRTKFAQEAKDIIATIDGGNNA